MDFLPDLDPGDVFIIDQAVPHDKLGVGVFTLELAVGRRRDKDSQPVAERPRIANAPPEEPRRSSAPPAPEAASQ